MNYLQRIENQDGGAPASEFQVDLSGFSTNVTGRQKYFS